VYINFLKTTDQVFFVQFLLIVSLFDVLFTSTLLSYNSSLSPLEGTFPSQLFSLHGTIEKLRRLFFQEQWCLIEEDKEEGKSTSTTR